MATITSTKDSRNFYVTLEVTQGKPSIANNSTVVNWTLKLHSGGWNFSQYYMQGTVTINGTQVKNLYNDNHQVSIGSNSSYTLASGSSTIPHNADGSKTLSFSFSNVNTTRSGAGTPSSNHSASGSMTLTKINRNPVISSLTVGSQTRNTFVVSWKADMTINQVSHSYDNKNWTYTNVNSTSGSFTTSHFNEGETKTVYVSVRSSASGLWSATSSVKGTTKHTSSLSNISVVPISGSNSSLKVSYTSTQTGGTTSVEYRVGGSGSWLAASNGMIISGLEDGKEYTVNLQAKNSSGEVNEYSQKGTVYAMPSGSFSLSQTNKTQLNLLVSNVKNATNIYYKYNSGAWTNNGLTTTKTWAVDPGSTHSVEIELRNTSTGLTLSLSRKDIGIPSNATPTVKINDGSQRNYFNMSLESSDASKHRYTLKRGGTSIVSNVEVTNSSSFFRVPAAINLVSDKTYTVEIQSYDKISNQWGQIVTKTATTKMFEPPTITIVPKLTSIEYTITPKDSCKLLKVDSTNIGAWSSFQTAAKKETLTTFNGANLEASKSYPLVFVFQDQYGEENTSIGAGVDSITKGYDPITAMISPSPASVTGGPLWTITDVNGLPVINVSSAGTYSKTTKFQFGSITYTTPSYTEKFQYSILIASLKSILQAEKNAKYYDIPFETFFTEDNRVSKSKQTGTIRLHFNDLLLKAPTMSVAYGNGAGNAALNRLYSSKINKITITTPIVSPVEGGSISSAKITFNGDSKTIANPAIKSETVFGEYENITSSTAVLEITDSRGLKSTSNLAVNTTTYIQPTISIRAFGRENGFTDVLELLDFSMGFLNTSNSPSNNPNYDSKRTNTINSIKIERAEGGSNVWTALSDGGTNLISKLGLGTIGNSGSFNKNKVIVGTGKGWFPVSSSYKIRITIQDNFYSLTGKETVSTVMVIPSGRGLLYLDDLNQQVGVNTTVPRGEFEVDGDAYFSNVYSINTIFFKPEDIE